MPRGPRFLPPGWSVEVTTRTICGFYLLPATASFARTMVGVLGKAQEKYPVQTHAAVAASNHYHLILRRQSRNRTRFLSNARKSGSSEKSWALGAQASRLHRAAEPLESNTRH